MEPGLPRCPEEPDESIRAWALRSCAAQGVPLKLTDAAVIRMVATLLRAGSVGVAAEASSDRLTLGAPDWPDPFLVETVATFEGWFKDDVVQHGA